MSENRLKRPLDPKAVKVANEALWKEYPELKRRQLKPSDPEEYRNFWKKAYREATGQDTATPTAPKPSDTPPGIPVVACPSPPPSCKVEIRANRLGSLPLKGDYYHLFIVFTDGKGEESYLRGGPSKRGPGSSGTSSEMSGGSSHGSGHDTSGSGSNPSASSDSGDSGPFGTIVTQYGPYQPGTIDWDPNAKTIEVANGPDACAKYEQLKAQMDAISASKTRYSPLGPNSNSTVFSALRNVGISPQLPNGVWAPGAEMPINTTK